MKDSDWEILYELHRNPNMTKVANLLYITQPSLTKRLQHMEAEPYSKRTDIYRRRRISCKTGRSLSYIS